jgi:hypothetical protein
MICENQFKGDYWTRKSTTSYVYKIEQECTVDRRYLFFNTYF